MHMSIKATDTPVYSHSRDVTFHRQLHHELFAIFPDNNYEMQTIFPGKHDHYTKSTNDWVISN